MRNSNLISRSRLAAAFAATLALTAHSAFAKPIDPKNPPDGRFADEWAEIHMAGGKVGYAHSIMARDGDRITTAMKFHMSLGRAAQRVTIEMTQATEESLDGEPISFVSETDMANTKSALRGEVKGDRVLITTSQFGMDQTTEYPFPKSALMNWGLFRESLIRGFKPGTTYTVDSYSPDLRLDGAVQAKTTVGEWETIEIDGKKEKGLRVTVSMQSPIGQMEMVSWVDEQAMPVKASFPIPGMGDLVLLTCDQKSALADFIPPEMFMTTVVKAKKTIDYKNANRILYRLRATGDDVNFDDLPQTAAQKVVERSEKSVKLEILRVPHTLQKTGKSDQLSKKQLDEFLTGNLMINVDDPELIKLAKRAAGNEKDPFVLADKLRVFVTDYVEEKNLNVGFATASEVARTKEGDCSEHGVLLAALGRIAGLPSRVAVGLAYVPIFAKQQDIFGYHMWTQFYIDGRWIDFDAALRESDCSPIRITFATSSLKNAGLADLSLPLLSKIGQIDIDVLEIDK